MKFAHYSKSLKKIAQFVTLLEQMYLFYKVGLTNTSHIYYIFVGLVMGKGLCALTFWMYTNKRRFKWVEVWQSLHIGLWPTFFSFLISNCFSLRSIIHWDMKFPPCMMIIFSISSCSVYRLFTQKDCGVRGHDIPSLLCSPLSGSPPGS